MKCNIENLLSRKTKSEAEKCNKSGTNTKTAGVIPFVDFDGFSPGLFVEFYLGLLHDEGECWLFPKPRDISKTFHPHSKNETTFYEKKRKVGYHGLELMLPHLCSIVGKPRCTNHALRATAVMYLRRAKLDWPTIIKVTGRIH